MRGSSTTPASNWQLVLAGTNLTEEYYSPAFFYTVSQQMWDGSVGRPREVYFGLNFDVQLIGRRCRPSPAARAGFFLR